MTIHRRTKTLLFAIPTISTALVVGLILYGVAIKDAQEAQKISPVLDRSSSQMQFPSVTLDDVFQTDNAATHTTARINDELYTLEIAQSAAERKQGLSGRESLDNQAGMLFVFPGDAQHGIWMKDMNFAIDILWLDADFDVVNMVQEAAPESYPATFRPQVPARYVIELPAGAI